MAKFKTALLATLIVASPLVASQAFAASYQVFKGGVWKVSDSTTLTGPTTATVAGIPIPCTATFTLTLNASGAATVTAASFSGSSACLGVTAQALPWTVAAPVAISGSSSVTVNISGINVKFSSPSATCTGNASGTLTNANPNTGPANNDYTFTAPLSAPCTNVKSNPKLTSANPIRAVFP